MADAYRTKLILEAEAESESLRLKGEAEAFAIEAKAKAEADQMLKKAEAMKEYKEAAIIDMVLDCLPKVSDWKCVARASEGRIERGEREVRSVEKIYFHIRIMV